ncbi:hypothetical protein C8R44DRAFT_772407 [Mycena epipterygia]|nr:hypothetical protein C8R44DRAFT_772407 [Mycena epipterygia]
MSQSAQMAHLRTRLEEISSRIIHQKEILRDLEQTRSDIQRDLNTFLDPMARLPLEITSEIFTLCLPIGVHELTPSQRTAPMLLLNVCRLWSTIALATPSLWASIRGEFPYSVDFAQLMDRWIRRAHKLPLSILLHGPLPAAVATVVINNAHQVQKLELYITTSEDLGQITTPYPSLTKLTIGYGADDDEDYYGEPDGADPTKCVAMLCAAPDLVSCTFEAIYYQTRSELKAPSIHSGLKHLKLGQKGEYSSAVLLRYLTLPGLTSLSLTDFDISDGDFLAFLTRSSPPLQLFKASRNNWSSATLQSLCRIVPNLADIDLTEHAITYIIPFLDVLASPGLLPRLRNLTLRGFPIAFSRAQYEKLLSALSVRRGQLQSFALLYFSETDPPDGDIISALQEFVGNGMVIHIGSRAQNHI